jgi:hypothetical protein
VPNPAILPYPVLSGLGVALGLYGWVRRDVGVGVEGGVGRGGGSRTVGGITDHIIIVNCAGWFFAVINHETV